MGIKAAVLGASGFAGAELLRILESHPEIQVVAASASSQVGKRVIDVYPALPSVAELTFVPTGEALDCGADIVFSSLPHKASMTLFADDGGPKVVDLGGDFRLNDPAQHEDWFGEPHTSPHSLASWVYGLTEFHRKEVAGAERVANPGCYPTAALLALLPLVSAGLVEPDGIHIDAKSGISGAGRAGGEGFDFASVNENLSPYKATGHKHIAEIEQELGLAAGRSARVSFVPHLVPMTRGLLASCVAQAVPGASGTEIGSALESAYRDEPFVRIAGGGLPHTKRLTGTNFAEVGVHLDERTGRVLAFGAIDNLGKGAAGQAVQNANLMLGLPEDMGLLDRPLVP
ncbi:MAG TPA: N-acetyl-gamma-glutamyl-phosphate reductase [Actinomycetota bacterium]|nr:N-acetyl-gamma-glutamyl-phosphate reductase [Actinomycetota bacterium]